MITIRNSVQRSLGVVTKNQTKRIGYFGPVGTFTEQALLTQSDLASCDLSAYRTVPDVLDAVESGEVDQGFVPIENSIEGTVNFTQDALVFDHNLLIREYLHRKNDGGLNCWCHSKFYLNLLRFPLNALFFEKHGLCYKL